MNYRLVTFLSVLVFLFTMGCAGKIKQNFLNEPYRNKRVSVELAITGIEVADARAAVDTGTLIIPGFTFKKIGDTIVPPLSVIEEKAIKDEIAQYAQGGKTAVRVKATIKTGIKEYSMGFFNSREFAGAAVNIDLLDTIHNTQLFSTTGEASYEVKSIRADTAFLESLYRKALKTCVYKAFENIEDYLENRLKEENHK
jgi:hypothetical protein